jgi:uncharacterized protein RhaS with RHS repeats
MVSKSPWFATAPAFSDSSFRHAKGDIVNYSYGYDAVGDITLITQSGANTSMSYRQSFNALHELVSSTDGLGNQTTYHSQKLGAAVAATFS